MGNNFHALLNYFFSPNTKHFATENTKFPFVNSGENRYVVQSTRDIFRVARGFVYPEVERLVRYGIKTRLDRSSSLLFLPSQQTVSGFTSIKIFKYLYEKKQGNMHGVLNKHLRFYAQMTFHIISNLNTIVFT